MGKSEGLPHRREPRTTFMIERSGEDRYRRVLARFRIGDTTAGQMLIREGLARWWRGRTEEWCNG
jgi:endonuclease YncB( thermonuclease family)